VKVSDGPVQGERDNYQPPPEDGKFDASKYKGGLYPFDEYEYQDPAYIFLKKIDEKMTAIIVNASDGEYITSINPTSGQMEDLQSNGHIELDTRPSMQLTLRLIGPKNSNL